jgi:hypothetical protein
MEIVFLEEAIVAGGVEAIVHQVPDSNDSRNMVWQRLTRGSDGWALDGGSSSGSFADLSIAIKAIPQAGSEQAEDGLNSSAER